MNNNSNVKELTVEADLQNLDSVIDFVDERLDELGCTMKAKMQIGIAVRVGNLLVIDLAQPVVGGDGAAVA